MPYDKEATTTLPTQDRTTELDQLFQPADLMVLTGDLAGRRYPVTSRMTIGRDPKTTIQVPGEDVSRRHAVIWQTDAGEYVIEDLGSRNGTLVNGLPIEVHVLRFGDKLQVGSRTLFIFTHHQALEEQLVRWQRLELVAQMTSGLVHDFNNYMTALLGFVQYLAAFSAREPTQKELMTVLQQCLPVMETAAKEGSNLAHKVLDFTRGVEHRPIPVNMASILEEAVALVRRTVPETIEIEESVENNLIVLGSRTELLQVMINLLLNARDAMPDGGTLRIEGAGERLDPKHLEQIGLHSKNGKIVKVKIIDTGVGMDEQTRKRIFEPLFTTKREGKGTGLGLSMVSRIIEQHNGLTQVFSKLGKGTEFSITLPAAQEGGLQCAHTTQVLSSNRDRFDKGLILMLEQDGMLRQQVAQAAHDLGLASLFSRTREETTELLTLHQKRIKLLIVNQHYLGHDTSADWIKQISSTITVLLVHDESSEEVEIEGISSLKVPSDKETLIKALEDTLEEKKIAARGDPTKDIKT